MATKKGKKAGKTAKKGGGEAMAAAMGSPLPDGIPFCRVRAAGGPLVVVLQTQGLLAAGARFEVIPVFGAVPPVLEEEWVMTVGNAGLDEHEMETSAKDLEGDAVNFQINLCALSAQFTDGTVEVRVKQDGADCPIAPPMRFELKSVPACDSAANKVKPTARVGGFAFVVA